MFFCFQSKGDANRIFFCYQLFLSLLNLHYLYIDSKCEFQVNMFKYAIKIEGRSLPIFPPYLSGM